jgi:DNA-binding response OmpR family regulator
MKRPTIFICWPYHGDTDPIAAYLKAKQYLVHCIVESSQAIEEITTHAPDLVLLDPYLSAAGGYEVCGTVRPYYHGPIIFLSEDKDEAAQLLAFERGADDYIFLPISPAVLTARINVHLKRGNAVVNRTRQNKRKVGELMVDAASREVFLAGEPIGFTSIQFELLWYLVKRSGRVVPREELYEALYKQSYNGFDRSVDVYISRIRHQLGDDSSNPRYLKTVRGVGYLLADGDGQEA